MRSKLNKLKKIKHSSLLHFTVKNQTLQIKGPLGINYINIPSSVLITVYPSSRVLYVSLHSNSFTNKKIPYLTSVFSAIQSSCQSILFGDLTSLNLEGLGFKFSSINADNSKTLNLLMSLGYSKDVHYTVNSRRVKLYIKSPRNVYAYSSDYSLLQNESHKILNLKVPDKYKNKGFYIKNLI